MFRTIKSTVLSVLSFSIIFLSCTKEYSIEKAAGGAGSTSGTAVFSLEGSPGVCASAFLSGSYTAGTAVTAANTVLVSANVTTIGTYTITTSTANGIKFTGAGSFTTTGLQFIELTASGTATAAGTFNYTSGTTGCSFPVTFTTSGGGGSGSGTAVFTFNGAPGYCTTATVSGVYTAGTALGAGNTVVIAVNVTTAGSYTISTGAANGISFSGSGVLALGAQTITLTGSGTPVAAGTNNFTPGTNGCAFPVITTGGNGSGSGTAVFSFNGAPGTCTTATVSGVYTAGTALGAGNTVVIAVNVTTAGSYTISTGAANGISFSGSGVLVLGAQTITLTGSGNPVAAGTNNFTAGTNGCAFTVTTVAGSGGGGGNFLKCTIGGVATQFNTNLTGTNNYTPPGAGTILLDGLVNSTGQDELQIGFVNISGAVTVGTYPNFTVTNFLKTILVIYTDNSGNQWQTSGSVNNTFTGTISSLSATSVQGTFSGTLYNNSGAGPGTKVITNGSFSVTF